MPRSQPFLRRLAHDRRGNVLMLAASIMFVLTALIGGAVDLSLVYRAQNRLQGACDAGALAARRAVTTNGLDATAIAQGKSYFNVNYTDAQQGTKSTAFTLSSTDNGVTVNGTATTTVPLRIMALFGRYTYDLSLTCASTQSIGNSDIIFVLDTTGSMSDSYNGTVKITGLQTALKNFNTTIINATAGTNARVRYGFVPYSSSVNVGRLLYNLSPSYLASTYALQTRVPQFEAITYAVYNSRTLKTSEEVYNSTPNSTPALYSSTAYASQSACFAALPATSAWTNNGSSSNSTGNVTTGSYTYSASIVTQPKVRSLYTCTRSGDSYYQYRYYAYLSLKSYTYSGLGTASSPTSGTAFDHFDYVLANVDTSTFKTFAAATTSTGSSGASQSSTWNGCIEERFTVSDSAFSYSSLTDRISPTTATDLNIDMAPTSDDATKWAPMWPDIAYYRGTSSSNSILSTSGSLANSYCPAAARTLATMTQTDFTTYVNSLTPAGSTYHDIGMLWGARLISSTGIFSSNVTEVPTNGGNVTRHIIYMTDGEPNAAYSIQQAYGIEYHDRRITDDGYSNDDNRHIARFRAVCDAIKGRGVRIWVIGYSTSLSTDLSYCASPDSGFTANSASELNSAFQQIAKTASALRVAS